MARNKYPEETERKILEVAFRLFQEKGYDHTTIQDIVNGLGMSKGAVYHHFKSKEEIVDRLYGSKVPQIDLAGDIARDPALTALEKLRKLFRLQLSDSGKLQVDALIAPRGARTDPRLVYMQLHAAMTQGAPAIQALLEEGIADGSITTARPRELAQALTILFNAWIGVFPGSKEEFMGKFAFVKALTDAMGAPIFDDSLLAAADHYYDRLAPYFTEP